MKFSHASTLIAALVASAAVFLVLNRITPPTAAATTRTFTPPMVLISSELASPWRRITLSVYDTKYEGQKTSSGKRYRHRALTCASNMHKLGAQLEVRAGARSVMVTVNDRLAKRFSRTRIDLSGAAFRELYAGYDMTDKTGTLLKGDFRVVAE